MLTASGTQFFVLTGDPAANSAWSRAGSGTDGRWYVGDFNGDGASDIFRYMAGQSGAEVLLSNSVAYFAPAGSWTGAGFGSDNQWHVADFNGDGRDDIARYVSDRGTEVLLSTGTSFAFAGLWSTVTPAGNPQFLFGDVDGDGREDLAFYQLNGTGVDVMLSTGSGFAAPTRWTDISIGFRPLGMGDFNGDGLADLIWVNPNNQFPSFATEVLL